MGATLMVTKGEAWAKSMESDVEQEENIRKSKLNIQKTENMGYKQSPFPMVSGTKGHSSALKQKEAEKKTKMLEGTTIFGKTIPEIKEAAIQAHRDTSFPIARGIKKVADFAAKKINQRTKSKKMNKEYGEVEKTAPTKQIKSEKEGKGKYHYKKAQHPKKQSPPEDEGLEVIKTNKRERISDIEDRISFLEEDVHAGNRTKAEVSPMIEKLKVALVKARK